MLTPLPQVHPQGAAGQVVAVLHGARGVLLRQPPGGGGRGVRRGAAGLRGQVVMMMRIVMIMMMMTGTPAATRTANSARTRSAATRTAPAATCASTWQSTPSAGPPTMPRVRWRQSAQVHK